MPMGDWGWWRLESLPSPYSSSGKYPPKQPRLHHLTRWWSKNDVSLSFFFFHRIASALYVKPFAWSGCGCLMPESVFVCFYIPRPPFCSAHIGLVVFGTMIKRDGDKTWLPSIWRHCLCHGAFLPTVLSARRKSGCVKFAVPTLQNWQESILLEKSGPRAPSSCRLYFSCHAFLIWMKESYWCRSHWAFSHSRGYYTCFHICLMLVDVSGGICCHSLFMTLDDMFRWIGLLISRSSSLIKRQRVVRFQMEH